MIDLESLALNRARALSQSETDWLEPIRTSFCDEACTVLSDGDIQQIFNFSNSATALLAAFRAVAAAVSAGDSAIEECISLLKNRAAGG